MVSRRVILLFLAASAVSVGDTAFISGPAHAQSTLTNVGPLPQRRIEPRRRQPQPVQTDDDPDIPAPAPPRAPQTDENGDPVEPGDSRDGDDPQRTEQQRNRDGEPSVAAEQSQQQDGAVQVGEPLPQPDGQPDTDRDPRLKKDIDAFEQPAAGYDALAFQIDGIDPLLDRRPARLARFEPYDPLGIRAGSWIIFPETELTLGVTNNVRRSSSADGAAFFENRSTVRAVTDWRQHAMELKASGLTSFFNGFASENDRAYALEARGRIDFSRRTNLEILVSHQKDQEKRSSVNSLDSAVNRADFITNRAAAAFSHRFNRLTVQLRGSITDIDYGGVSTTSGSFASNDQRDVTEYGTGARATWAFNPTLLAFTDVSVNDRHYRGTPSDGISRDSRGIRAVAGVSFGNTGKIWRGEVSAGYGTQRPDDSRISSTGGFILDANLSWRMSELTSLLFTANTTFNDSTTPGESGSRAQTFGIEGRHSFTRQLLATAALRNTNTTFSSGDQRETTAELGVEYFLNRHTTLSARYAHIDFGSSAPGGDYTVDTVRFGIRIRQ